MLGGMDPCRTGNVQLVRKCYTPDPGLDFSNRMLTIAHLQGTLGLIDWHVDVCNLGMSIHEPQ